MIKKYIGVVILVVMFLAACRQSSAAELKIYDDTQNHKISFSYPDTWTVNTSQMRVDSTAIYNYTLDKNHPTGRNLNSTHVDQTLITLMDQSKEEQPLDFSLLLDDLKSTNPDMVTGKTILVQGKPAVVARVKNTQPFSDGVTIDVTTYLVEVDPTHFILVNSSFKDDDQAQTEAVVRSIKLL